MNLSKYVAEYLYQSGVRSVFMRSGTGSIHLDDAFAFHKGLRYVCARHEAAAMDMAVGYAKLTGGLGVVIATTGPGGTNAVGGLVEAWVDSVPIVVISGQVPKQVMSETARSFGVQGFRIVDVVKPMTKYAALVTDPQKIRIHLEEACYKAREGRQGPVWLDIPWDVQSADIDIEGLIGFHPAESKEQNALEFANMDSLLDALREAKRPVLLAGQGIRTGGAQNEFIKFINRLQIPVLFARMGLDVMPYSHPLNFGLAGMRGRRFCANILDQADLVIGLATSMSYPCVGDAYIKFQSDTKFALVNIDKMAFTESSTPVHFPICAHIKDFLVEMNRRLCDTPVEVPADWLNTCTNLKTSFPTVLPNYAQTPINSYYFIQILEAQSTRDAVFVSDAGSAYYICGQGLAFEGERREVSSGAFASMGVAIPLGIGCSCAFPERQILVVTGDGSIELNIQELRTISQNQLNIKVFVINNGGYASIRASQDVIMGGRYTDDQSILNFAKVATAFDLPFYLLESHTTLAPDISKILKTSGPALIEVVCDRNQAIIAVGSPQTH
jgi:acetolactate synthase-1/2/3 large subunit